MLSCPWPHRRVVLHNGLSDATKTAAEEACLALGRGAIIKPFGDLFAVHRSVEALVVVMATGQDGEPPMGDEAVWAGLRDAFNDHRVGKGDFFPVLRSFQVVGRGDRSYGKKLFCKPARELQRILSRMAPCTPTGPILMDIGRRLCWPLVAMRLRFSLSNTSQIDVGMESDFEVESSDTDSCDESSAFNSGGERRDMISGNQEIVLRKQGYKLVGSHSATKLCRWTKSHLKGHGGCYKHTFYGIDSSGCMESTPSLACANKCTFCWRHHKNPVGRSWRWETDEPRGIVDGLIKEHVALIQNLRTSKGTIPERYDINSQRPRHVALSLVGEPIMYPHIQELCHMFHEEGLSTFLVSNAQFPSEMNLLTTVTQLYLSIDACEPEVMKNIGRPLFRDSWDRMIKCLDINSRRNWQRTVFRQTLVKDQNMIRLPTDDGKRSPVCPVIVPLIDLPPEYHEEAGRYAGLVLRAMPTFVELKGFTYSGAGSSDDALGIHNAPHFEEVVAFANRMLEADPIWPLAQAAGIDHRNPAPDISLPLGESYKLVSVHEHSNSVLLCRGDFVDDHGRPLIWIDYEKFLAAAKKMRDLPLEPIDAREYSKPAPDWAMYHGGEAVRGLGFDPADKRRGRGQRN